MQLARLLCAVAVAAEDVVPGDTSPRALDRGEDAFHVDGSMARGLGGVVDDDLAEVVRGLERVRREDPDLDEVVEVPVAVEVPDPLR